MASLLIYHIADRESFLAQRSGVSADGASYAPAGWERDGFVHCSGWSQLPRVARTFFADRSDLIVLEIDAGIVNVDLRYERVSDTPDDYPHVYGPIPGPAIVGCLGVAWPAPGIPRFDRLAGGADASVAVEPAWDLSMRRAGPDDRREIARMNHQLREDEGYLDELSVSTLERRLADWIADGYDAWLYTATADQSGQTRATVGYALVDPRRSPLYIRQLFIVRGARRSGFGRRAVDSLTDHYGGDAFDVDALRANGAAMRFWHSLGFRDRVVSMRLDRAAPGPRSQVGALSSDARRAAGAGAVGAPSLAVITGDTSNAHAFVVEGLQSFNDRTSPYLRSTREPDGSVDLAVMLGREDGAWVGGAVGSVHWGWLSVDYVWIAEPYRGHGYGRMLVEEIERHAVAHGATRAYLSTYHFQARGLYEKLGYRVVGELTDLPPGGAKFWMRKDRLADTMRD